MAAYTHLVLRTGEVFLKGKNQHLFERKLQENIFLLTGRKSKLGRGRLYLPYFAEHKVLGKVFGLTSYSPAVQAEKEIGAIQRKAVRMLQEKKGTFRIETQRSDKSFPLPSPEIKVVVGRYVEEHTSLECSLQSPDIVLQIEINQEGAFLFLEKIHGMGGMPAGVEGAVYLLPEDDASILAGLLMMKRGCDLVLIGDKAKTDLLQEFSPRELKMVSSMENAALPVVSGQTFDCHKELPYPNIVFRPLIGYIEDGIKEELEKFKRIL